MEATERNERIAREVINLLAENGCTVAEANDILHWVLREMQRFATVHRVDQKLFEC